MSNNMISLLLIMCVNAIEVTSEKQWFRQKRAWIIDSFSIEEEHPGPFPYELGQLSLEKKFMLNFVVHGQGVDEDPKGILEIDNEGVITVHKKVDYEKYKVLRVRFEAKYISTGETQTNLAIDISIKDINDHAPQFSSEKYEVSVQESTQQGEHLVTLSAADGDDSRTNNGTFSFTIVSVTPNNDNVKFFIKKQDSQIAEISFKGCLDYETAQKYTILVEAKDHGEKVQLSSTTTVIINIIDRNNHLPVFSGLTGTGNVKERETDIPVYRLQVTDRDTEKTAAWKAKYIINGDPWKYFKIETDPASNEGVITVVKPLDFEEHAHRNLLVTVENEEAFFSCEVKGRPSKGLWDVVYSRTLNMTQHLGFPLNITVEDVNDPPVFTEAVKHVTVFENVVPGKQLETFTAQDLDRRHSNTFEFFKGNDPANWVTVDSKTGQVSTAKVIDRESSFVKDSTYTVTLLAVDNGEPPMTGTGTLIIHIKDQNDNVPVLSENKLNLCLSDEPTRTKLSAVDPDLPPYSGPFLFELIGDVEGKWSLDPFNGTVSLVKGNSVHAGNYTLTLKISDLQEKYSLQLLSVVVCDCSVTSDCRHRKTSTWLGGGGVGIKLNAFLDLEEKPGHYEPSIYAYEGDYDGNTNLDAISIPDSGFTLEELNNLDPKFKQLASICQPDLVKM
ncbi:cadherin-like protein 26 [Chanos chanos]|uniref:Cadherin-like protein 26 n=1 Tax=Chanos chanos TaxID=29144 RepID=A0A6J2UUC5_CHACN|nr:cadherin-like protein 26 [Chanos chanos]